MSLRGRQPARKNSEPSSTKANLLMYLSSCNTLLLMITHRNRQLLSFFTHLLRLWQSALAAIEDCDDSVMDNRPLKRLIQKNKWKRSMPVQQAHSVHHAPHVPRNPGLPLNFNLKTATGIEHSDLDIITELVSDSVVPTTHRRRMVPVNLQLIVTLTWLRRQFRFSELAQYFQISSSQCYRIVRSMIPHLVSSMNYIQLPESWPVNELGCSGAIDGSTHPRNRIHPGQALLYRGDKGGHMLSAQVIVDMFGSPVEVVICLGHNTDQRMLVLTSLEDRFASLRNVDGGPILFMADKGYSSSVTVSPKKKRVKEATKNLLSEGDPALAILHKKRAIVENFNAEVKHWSIAKEKNGQCIFLHAYGLMVVYQLASLTWGRSRLNNLEN